MEKTKKALILFMKEAEEKKVFETKSHLLQDEAIEMINEFVEKNKNNQKVMDWLFKLEVKILEMGEAFKQDYFQLGYILHDLKKEQEETKLEKSKK